MLFETLDVHAFQFRGRNFKPCKGRGRRRGRTCSVAKLESFRRDDLDNPLPGCDLDTEGGRAHRSLADETREENMMIRRVLGDQCYAADALRTVRVLLRQI